jgi:urease accessory protein
MSCSVEAGTAELVFARRGGRTVLVHSRVTAPVTLVRSFELADGRQLVPLITLGPGFCGGDRVHVRLTAGAGTDVIVTTTAATRVLSMRPGESAVQDVEIVAEADAAIQYYPLSTIPFPDSAFAQTLTVRADSRSRVGVMETWALGRTARDEYLQFRSLSSRTTLDVNGGRLYTDVAELRPRGSDGELTGIAVLAGRRYLASGFWYGATLADEPRDGAADGDLLIAFAQSRPGLVYLRALASDAPSLERTLGAATARIAGAWGQAPVSLARFRC